MIMRRLFMLVLLVGAAAVGRATLPDIKRYLEMRRM
jgi:hypothetical protein